MNNANILWFNLFQAAMTIIIAALVAWIHWRQHKLEARQYQFATYDRKLKIFTAVRKVIAKTLALGNFPVGDCEEFWEARTECPFLFDDKMTNFLEEIWRRGVSLHTSESLLKADIVDREKVVEKSAAEITWFSNEIKNLQNRFLPYMRLDEKAKIL